MPLSDLIVVEFASVLAGPSVGMFFAELGAEVVKIENFGSGGDVTRSWRLPQEADAAFSAYYTCVNWGKKSVGIDLRSDGGTQVAHDLVRRADIVLVSFKSGDAEKLCLDYATLSAMNPRLVYGEITAYGPEQDGVGYDAVIQAESGFTFLNGTADSGPLKMPVALMDVLAAHQLKEGCLLALLELGRTGRGSRVSVSLARSGLSALINQAANWLQAGARPERLGSGHPNIVPYGSSWRTADEAFVVLAVGNDRQFRRLCTVLGRPDAAQDERFATNPARVQHRIELEAILEPAIGAVERENLLTELRGAGVPAGPILDIPDALAAPAAKPMILEGEEARGVRGIALEPSSFYRPVDLAAPPRLNADSIVVLRDLLEYDQSRIEGLIADGTLGQPEPGEDQ